MSEAPRLLRLPQKRTPTSMDKPQTCTVILEREAEDDREVFKQNESISMNHTTQVANEKQNKSNNSTRSITAWRYDMEGHPVKCVERCCDLAGNKSA